MRNKSFGDFMNKKKRDGIDHLNIVEKILRNNGLKVENFINEDNEGDPYVFCYNPLQNASFNGVRIYILGDQLAFRVQNEKNTHPYGSAYPLNIEEMFHDFLSDKNLDKEKAGKKVIESISKEIKKFFEKSSQIEKDERGTGIDGEESSGNVIASTMGTDYSSLIHSKV